MSTTKQCSRIGRHLPMYFGPSATEQRFLELAESIGTAGDLAPWASAEIALYLDKHGIDPGRLTLAQAAAIVRGEVRHG